MEKKKKKKAFVEKILQVNKTRLDYLNKRSIIGALKNLHNINYYPTKKSYVSDLLYLVNIF